MFARTFTKARALLLVSVAVTSLGATAHGQFIVPGPNGSLGFNNFNGTYSYLYPGRMSPWANIPQPGTYKQTPWGPAWVGMDNKLHGNFQDPSTGDFHYQSLKTSAGTGGQTHPESLPAPVPNGMQRGHHRMGPVRRGFRRR